ncbi:MAG TPA: hypothetical protein DCK95_02230 [Anaerolineaceae bacterium]|nr:hypothetical protein [Anaerolineaceae bacterium]
MKTGWLSIVLLVAMLDWYAVWHEKERLNRFTKPATMMVLLGGLGLSTGFDGNLKWFGWALGFGLLGDIFLLRPQRYFFYGLLAFLLGHLAYIAGLWFPLSMLRLSHFILMAVIVLLLVFIAPRILKGISSRASSRKLKLPVIFYMLVISVMVFFSVSTLFSADWQQPAAGLTAIGGCLFFCSDTMLAYREFVADFPKGRFWVRVTYHLAQIALTLAAILQFSA